MQDQTRQVQGQPPQPGLLADGPVEQYLDQLFDQLAGTGAAGRRALAEAEDHLRSAVAEAQARGAPAIAAEQEAVHRFGAAGRVGAALRLTHLGLGAVLRPAFTGAWLLGIIGLFGIGASGLLAWGFGAAFGKAYVAGDPSGVTYTPARCAELREYYPHASTCAAAAIGHHFDETVQYRVAAGVLGLLALGALWLARRVLPSLRSPAWRPPAGLLALAGTVLFGVIGAALAGPSLLGSLVTDNSGQGGPLTGGVVSLIIAAGIAMWGLRRTHRARVTAA